MPTLWLIKEKNYRTGQWECTLKKNISEKGPMEKITVGVVYILVDRCD